MNFEISQEPLKTNILSKPLANICDFCYYKLLVCVTNDYFNLYSLFEVNMPKNVFNIAAFKCASHMNYNHLINLCFLFLNVGDDLQDPACVGGAVHILRHLFILRHLVT